MQQHAHPGTTAFGMHFFGEFENFQALQHHVHIPLLEKPFALQGCQVLLECGDEHRVIFAVARMATEMVLGRRNDKGCTFKPKELDTVGNGILIEAPIIQPRHASLLQPHERETASGRRTHKHSIWAKDLGNGRNRKDLPSFLCSPAWQTKLPLARPSFKA